MTGGIETMPYCDICGVGYPARLQAQHQRSRRHYLSTIATEKRAQLEDDGYALIPDGRVLRALTRFLSRETTAIGLIPELRLVSESWAPKLLVEFIQEVIDGTHVVLADGRRVFVGAFMDRVLDAYERLQGSLLFDAFKAALQARAIDVALDIAKESDT